jgi:hypothetical protein
VTLRMTIQCDMADGACDVTAEIRDYDPQPASFDDSVGIVVDTNWITLPQGWRVTASEVDGPPLFACPEHS